MYSALGAARPRCKFPVAASCCVGNFGTKIVTTRIVCPSGTCVHVRVACTMTLCSNLVLLSHANRRVSDQTTRSSVEIYTRHLFAKLKLQLQLVFDRESFKQFYLGSEGLARET